MNKKIILNEEMKCLVNKKIERPNNLVFSQEKFKELLLPNFAKEHNCITITNEDDSFLEDEEKFIQFVKETYTDYTGYEASNTETYINYFLEEENLTLNEIVSITFVVIEVWGQQLKLLEPESQFCFIISCDTEYESVTMRFHKVRSEELMWLGEGWENSKTPVGCIFI